ncbi:MAG TPA: ABC transporter permease, partial [Gemmatimonadaceae bacterium]|nr:ABC transporter permease [Gemmatimonadaceae bacterium]
MALRAVQLPGATKTLKMYQDMRGDFRRDVIGGPSLFSYPEYADYRDHNHVFTELAGFAPEFRGLVDAEVKPVEGQLASCNYFAVVGVAPIIGRGFLPNECAATDAGPVVVLSDAFWRSHFAADPTVIGRTMKLNRVPLTIIGIMPAGFTGTEIMTASYWVPLSMQWSLFGRTDKEPFQARDDLSWLTLLGRLKPGISETQARADLSVIAGRRDAEAKNRVTTLQLSEPNMFARRDMRQIIMRIGTVFLVAVGLVLLIACANIANLFLARATTRQREIAIRLAIGASRAQLVRQLLVESLLIAVAGGVLGTAVSFSSARALVAVLLRTPDIEPLAIHVMPDARVFAYALLLVVIAASAFGLVPALHATRPDLNGVLKEGADGSGSRSRLRSTFVGVQVAVSMVLLVTAGLLLRGLSHAQSVDPGFALDNTTMMTVNLRAEGYGPERAIAYHRALGGWLRTVPGVVAFSEAATAPLAGRHYFGDFRVAGGTRRHQMQYNLVSPGFFASVAIPIVRGRDFGAAEANGPYAIVSEAAARQLWPGRDPVGQVLQGEHDYTVIGVAHDAQVSELGQTHEPYLYLSANDRDAMEVGTVIVRSTAPAATVAEALRAGALAQDRDLHLRIAPLRDNIRSYIETSQFLTSISGTLAAFALLLASIGIYGTVAFTVARRTREIGIRMALGAAASDVIVAVARDAMRTIAIGGAIGLILCALVTRVLERVLFGVSALDPTAFMLVPAVLFGVALVATYLPAKKAVRVDPLVALRSE